MTPNRYRSITKFMAVLMQYNERGGWLVSSCARSNLPAHTRKGNSYGYYWNKYDTYAGNISYLYYPPNLRIVAPCDTYTAIQHCLHVLDGLAQQ